MSNSSSPTWTQSNADVQVNSVALSADGSVCVYGTSSEFDSGVFAVECYDQDGNQKWSQPISDGPTYQGVFWVDVSQDGSYAAAGGETAKSDSGFLRGYRCEDGNPTLVREVSSRVNQVSFSADGTYLVAVYGATLELFKRTNAVSGAYSLIASESLSPFYLNSCKISGDGSTVVVSAIDYGDDDSQSSSESGAVFGFAVNNDGLQALPSLQLSVGCMRVDVVEDGSYWGASLHDGSCLVVSATNPGQALWQYTPAVADLYLAYAFAMNQQTNGMLSIAVGANVGDGGYLYALSYSPGDAQPVFLWGNTLEYAANPGVSIDAASTLVTATDGKPSESGSGKGSVPESAGNFYLFEFQTGTELWQYPTTLMNWPMMVSLSGNAVFGGSDNGTVYYWKLE